MARQAEGWKLVLPPGRKVYAVRFRWQGVRHFLGTGCSDPGEASIEAARIYSDTVSGRQTSLPISGDLTDTVADFLAHYATLHAKGTADTVEMYFSAHIIPHFRALQRFTAAGYSDYIAARITQVTRSSLRKELSALRQFRDWLGARGTELPEVPRLRKDGNPGRRAPNARKVKATIISPAEAKRILAAMPERSRRTGTWVRPLFVVLWETGLRPSTVLRLRAGVHFTKGSGTLAITEEIDKEGYQRDVPLSQAARRALDRVWPSSGAGLLFDVAEDNLRHSLAAALRVTELTDRKIGVYDFKHSRISLDANSGANLAGIAYLVGHKHLSTTSRYVTTSEEAARSVINRKGRA
jgi:integrase